MRIVAKIGTSSLTGEHGAINRGAIAKLSDEVVTVRENGHEVLVISSGAVAAGVAALGLMTRPTDMPTLQALAAAGQSRLMEVWNAELGRHGVVAAQALLDPHDFVNRKQYLHTRQTLVRLLELGCVPVINENDAIANDDDRYGDNDRLAALTAHNVGADVLVLLTDLDGLYTSDPRLDADAQLVRHVSSDDPLLAIRAGVSGSGRGSGGMASKLAAARIASWSGVRTVIAKASGEQALVGAVNGDVGTVFEPHTRRLSARKLWIAFASHVAGAVVVDDGARRALTERTTSLLPAGVTDVVGGFGEGDIVDVRGSDGAVFARGMVFVDSADMRRAAGKHTRDLPEGMVHEVIHRDDLVLLPASRRRTA